MSSGPLISVVIPAYNSARFVLTAVRSALGQTYSEVEVIVVDDGSTDDTREQLESVAGRIRYLYQPNGGVSKARNRGIQEARGEIIAFLDADDEWLPEKLAKQLAYMRANPSSPLVHADVYQLHEPEESRIYVDRGRNRFAGACYSEFFWANRVITSTVVVTKQCLDRIGLFDERIRGASTEDKDLWFRIARHFPLGYVNEALAHYRVHAGNGSLNQRRMVEDECYVLAKALEADPKLWATIGRYPARRKMAELAFHAGYANVDDGNLGRARRYFGVAIRYAPWRLNNWAFWASTFIPARLRQRLRRAKQHVVPVPARTDRATTTASIGPSSPCVVRR